MITHAACSAVKAQKGRSSSRYSAMMVHLMQTVADALPGTGSRALLTALLEEAEDFL